jgi:hypothetical protein
MLHRLPNDLLHIIGSFIIEPIYIVKQEYQNVDWDELCMNPRAMPMIQAHPTLINGCCLSLNPNATPYLEQHPEFIHWYVLSENPAAISLLERNLDKVNTSQLCSNPAAVHLLEARPDWIHWRRLCSNPAAVDLIKANPDAWDWPGLSKNPAFISEIVKEEHFHQLDWMNLTQNPAAISFIREHLDYVDAWGWMNLSENPAAIPLLLEHPDRIHYEFLSANPALLTCGNQDLIDRTRRFCIEMKCYSGFSRHPDIFELDEPRMKQAFHTWIRGLLFMR